MKPRKKFIEITPEMAEPKHEQRAIPPELIELVVKLALRGRESAGTDQKTVYSYLSNYIGLEFIRKPIIELAASLALLCRKLADGTNKSTAYAYLNYWIWYRSYTGFYGRDLLEVVTEIVKRHLEKLR